jgi:hypothetical protein
MNTAPQVTGQDLLPRVVAAAGNDRSNPAMPAGGPERSALHGLSGISRGGLEAAEEVRSRCRPCNTSLHVLNMASMCLLSGPNVYSAAAA